MFGGEVIPKTCIFKCYNHTQGGEKSRITKNLCLRDAFASHVNVAVGCELNGISDRIVCFLKIIVYLCFTDQANATEFAELIESMM